MWCRLCGRHAELRVKQLAQPCPKIMTPQAASRVGRIHKQQHPTSKARLGAPWIFALEPKAAAQCLEAAKDPRQGKHKDQTEQAVLSPDFDEAEADIFWDEAGDDYQALYRGDF